MNKVWISFSKKVLTNVMLIVIWRGLRTITMYCKLFASLYQGTLRGRSHEILVFTNLLANADASGYVDKHFNAIGQEVGLSREEVEQAIKNLESPDTESRSPEFDGARIVKMDEHRAWGWRIVNYGKYRAIRSEEDRREQNRMAQERFRNKSKHRKPPSAQAEAEAEEKIQGAKAHAFSTKFKKPTIEEVLLLASKSGLPELEAQKFFNYYESNGWKVGRNPMKSWTHALVNWKNNTQTYGNSTRIGEKRIDRSIGTANEGIAKKYAGMGRVVQNELVPRS